MTVSIELPLEIETALRERHDNIQEAAKEACLVEFYRQGQLTHYQLAQALDLDRYSTDGVLKRHGVQSDISDEELRRQVEVLKRTR
jgi:Uncharacterised protein family (UPF0175)